MRQITFNQKYTTSSASATVTAGQGTTTQTPPDTCRYLERAVVFAQAGGAQTINHAQLSIRYLTGGEFYFHRRLPLLVAPSSWGFDFPLGMLLLPGTIVSAAVNFSAGAVANDVQLSLVGFEMPRGNLA